ncbi:hypothetical protein PCL_05414 [Purpureocillium lilacinum]|uniref:Uncharacterized protein n=1 Tax=Purpureocillium lilacinum TaxID=33203 RepID=A0A2U3DVB2_PURLI|nr:hypothetical protein PCL_05414 [Purpureocillium lilacinum]
MLALAWHCGGGDRMAAHLMARGPGSHSVPLPWSSSAQHIDLFVIVQKYTIKKLLPRPAAAHNLVIAIIVVVVVAAHDPRNKGGSKGRGHATLPTAGNDEERQHAALDAPNSPSPVCGVPVPCVMPPPPASPRPLPEVGTRHDCRTPPPPGALVA